MRKKAEKINIVLLNKIGMFVIIIIALFAIVFYWYYTQVERIDYPVYFSTPHSAIKNQAGGEFVISGESFNVINGRVEKDGNGRISVMESINDDINGDLKKDSVFLIAYSDGDKISYYIAASIAVDNKYISTNAVFIGNEIIHIELFFDGSDIAERYYEKGEDYKSRKNEKIVYLKYLEGEIKQIIK